MFGTGPSFDLSYIVLSRVLQNKGTSALPSVPTLDLYATARRHYSCQRSSTDERQWFITRARAVPLRFFCIQHDRRVTARRAGLSVALVYTPKLT